jgi:RNA polymerase sigma-70 factor (ECF subfamily)
MSDPRPPPRLDTEALFQQYAAFVASFLARLGVAPGDLDDVLQEVFLVVHAHGGYVDGPAKPSSYLGAIAVRAAANYRRRQTTIRARSAGISPEQLGSKDLDPVQTLQLDESARALHEAMLGLDPALCATLVLVDHEGDSPLSVATSMGVAVGTVYWRLHKARKTLRKALAEQEARGSRRPLSKGEVL